jgi:hypothetical protein
MEIWAIAVSAVVGLWLARLMLQSRRRTHRARSLARELVPEIRRIMEASDPKAESDGDPGEAPVFKAHRQDIPAVFSREALFSVETFYQCLEAYRDARLRMTEAFSDSSDVSLGDRIRAKDRRDRLLKDLFYSGAASLEHLEELS